MRVRKVFAAAIASTPDPVPRSSTRGSSPPLCQIVERQQTAARGAVVAGAEGERGFDLDADLVGLDAGAVVRAVHDEAAGAHRLSDRRGFPATQSAGATGSMVSAAAAVSPAASATSARKPASSGRSRKWIATCHWPPSSSKAAQAVVIGVEAFAEIGREPPGGRLVAGETGDGGGSHAPAMLPHSRLVKPLAMAM